VLSYNDIGPAGGEAIAKGLQVMVTTYFTCIDVTDIRLRIICTLSVGLNLKLKNVK